MKLTIFVLFCLIFTLRDASVNCGLVEKLFEKGHETIEKVKEDVNKIFHFDKKEKGINEPKALSTTPQPIENAKKTATDMQKNEGIKETTENAKKTAPYMKNNEGIEETTTENAKNSATDMKNNEGIEETTTENAKKTATDMKKNEGIEETTTATKSTTNSPTATAAVTTSSTPPASNSTEPQEGRDAFNGDVCAEGYKRTTDGRCKKME